MTDRPKATGLFGSEQVSEEDRKSGRAWASRLDDLAASIRREGRAALADELTGAAVIMRKLSA